MNITNHPFATVGPDPPDWVALVSGARSGQTAELESLIRAAQDYVYNLALILMRQYKTVALMLLISTVMPLGDALLVLQQGAPTATVVRHVLILLIVAIAGIWLLRSVGTLSAIKSN